MKKKLKILTSYILCFVLVFGVNVGGLFLGKGQTANAAGGSEDLLMLQEVQVLGSTTPVLGDTATIETPLEGETNPEFTLVFNKNVNSDATAQANCKKVALYKIGEGEPTLIESTVRNGNSADSVTKQHLYIKPAITLEEGQYKIVIKEGIVPNNASATSDKPFYVLFSVGSGKVAATYDVTFTNQSSIAGTELVVKDAKGTVMTPDEKTGGSKANDPIKYSLKAGSYTYVATLPGDIYIPTSGNFTVVDQGINISFNMYRDNPVIKVQSGGTTFNQEGNSFYATNSLENNVTPTIELNTQSNGALTAALIDENQAKIITKKDGVVVPVSYNMESKSKILKITPTTAFTDGMYEITVKQGFTWATYKTVAEYKIFLTVGVPALPSDGKYSISFQTNPAGGNVMVWETANKSNIYEAVDGVFHLPADIEYTYVVTLQGFALKQGKFIADKTKTIYVPLEEGTVELFGVSSGDAYCWFKSHETEGTIRGEIVKATKPSFKLYFTGMGSTNYESNKDKISMVKTDGDTNTNIELDYEFNEFNTLNIIPKEELTAGNYSILVAEGAVTADGKTTVNYKVNFTVVENATPPKPIGPTQDVTFTTEPADASVMVWSKANKSEFYDAVDGVFKLPVGEYTYIVSQKGYVLKKDYFSVTDVTSGAKQNFTVALDEKSISLLEAVVNGQSYKFSGNELIINQSIAVGEKPEISLVSDLNTNYLFATNKDKITMKKQGEGSNIELSYGVSPNAKNLETTIISPTKALSEGIYVITVAAGFAGDDYDDVVRTKSDYTITFLVKSTSGHTNPPMLKIFTPNEDTSVTNKDKILVSGETDAGCVVEINNEKVAVENGIFKNEVTLTPGLNKIKITSTNAEGKSTDAFWNVTYDNVAPLLTISSPKNNLITNKAKITITGTSEKGATVKVNGTVVTLDAKNTFRKDVSLTKGVNTIKITATDAAGNTSEAKLQVTYDNVAPVLTITSPKNNLLTNKAKVTVNGSSEKGAIVKINGAVVPLNTKNVFSKAVTLKKGVNTLTITATDAAGNTKTTKLKVTYDNAAVLKIISPKNNLKTKLSKVTISGSSEKGAKVKINGKVVKLNAKNSFSKVVTLKKGVNTVTITAKDAAGNTKTVKVKVTRLK